MAEDMRHQVGGVHDVEPRLLTDEHSAEVWPRPPSRSRLGHAKIALDIIGKIDDGTLAPGSKLPTYYELPEIYGTSPSTIGLVLQRHLAFPGAGCRVG